MAVSCSLNFAVDAAHHKLPLFTFWWWFTAHASATNTDAPLRCPANQSKRFYCSSVFKRQAYLTWFIVPFHSIRWACDLFFLFFFPSWQPKDLRGFSKVFVPMRRQHYIYFLQVVPKVVQREFNPGFQQYWAVELKYVEYASCVGAAWGKKWIFRVFSAILWLLSQVRGGPRWPVTCTKIFVDLGPCDATHESNEIVQYYALWIKMLTVVVPRRRSNA
jgi:hypothetical protein